MTKVLIIAIAVLELTLSGLAKQHPVPLERNTSDSKCIECHEDRTKGKTVHAAVSMGCSSCHKVEVDGEITHVKLTGSKASTLCFQCHENKKAEKVRGKMHAPAVGDCTKCHDPHVSENKYLLLKPDTGSKPENLCLTCHQNGLNVDPKGSRHAALDMGCGICHVTHKAGSSDQQENAFHLTKPAPALCTGCHDVQDKKLIDAHRGLPFAKANCIQCHDAHSSNSPKLAARHLHPPFSEGTCTSCHEAAKEGKVKLSQDGRALCVTCHAEQAENINKAKVAHAGAQGDCTVCHDAHASLYPHLVKPNPVSACESCHSTQAEQHKTSAVLHDPAFNGNCSNCHAPHGGERPHLLVAEPNDLCLGCHYNVEKKMKIDKESKTINFPWGRSIQFAEYNRASKIGLDRDDKHGHPVMGHPTDGTNTKLANDPPLNCLSCHQPHASATVGLLPVGVKDSISICVTCHGPRSEKR